MAALDTVADYISEARILLQDTIDGPYRYADSELVSALNFAFLEARKLRPDMFLASSVPSYSATSTSTLVVVDLQYRVAFLYYICGHMLLRDDEIADDKKAVGFISSFNSSERLSKFAEPNMLHTPSTIMAFVCIIVGWYS